MNKKENKIEFLIKDDKIHYNNNRCNSFNAFINILIGGRGVGKTTNVLAPTIKNCVTKNVIKNGLDGLEEFIYLRRYKTETMKTKQLLNKYIKGAKLSIQGDGNACVKYKVNTINVGYSISLSCANAYKSVDFPYVKTIIYDEAILKPSGNYRYLKDEITALLEFVSTIFRSRTNCKIYILGNNLDVFNPYFSYFNIPTFKKEYYDVERSIYIAMVESNQNYIVKEKETPLYKLTKNTSYGNYHYNNDILVSDQATNYICDKPVDNELLFRIGVYRCTLNVYLVGELTLYIEYKDKLISDNITYEIIDINGNVNYYVNKLFRRLNFCKLLIKEFSNRTINYNNTKAITLIENVIECLT